MTVRIIAGERRGTILRTPPGEATRPTLGRIRGSLFMILMPTLPQARVLDLFAGSGALGLEALSRGARSCMLIEQAPAALEVLRANVAKLRWEDRARILAANAAAFLRQTKLPAEAPFDLILLDPPYHQGLCDAALTALGAVPGWLAADGWIAAQADRADMLQEAYGPLCRFRESSYGRTRVAFYRAAS